MGKFEFKQAAILGRGKAGTNSVGKIFGKGVHEVSEEHQKDATFKHFAKHELIVPFKPKDAPQTLKPASSDIAKGAEAAAKAALEPDAEIGGDDAEPDFGGDEEKHHGKKKKGK